MSEEIINKLKKNIVAIGRLLWEKELVTGLNGNISARVDDQRILLTATETCLGLLKEKDILLMDLDGTVIDEGDVSKEHLLHTQVYKKFPSMNAMIHTHTTYTNAYFLKTDLLIPKIFETRLYLGEVKAVAQHTPAVTNIQPVVEALKSNNIVVLQNHGVVSVGKNLFDCFLLIQCLEDSVKIEAINRLFHGQDEKDQSPGARDENPELKSIAAEKIRRFKLFSKDQIDEIVRLVNEDTILRDLGLKTDMTMDLAVKLNETGQVYSFRFEKGCITNVGNDAQAEFLISAPRNIWHAVFNRQIDPFVATTQKKMRLQGDFARISKWYAPCSRIFEIWQSVPVE